MGLLLKIKDIRAEHLDKIIRFFMFIFVIGSPFSISFAQIGLVSAMIFWLLKVIFLNKGNCYGTFLDFAIFLYILGTLVTSFFCEYSSHAFKSIQEIWQIIMLYMLLDVADEKYINKLVNVLFLFTFLTSVYGIWQFFYGQDLIRGRSLHPFGTGSEFYTIKGGFGNSLTQGGYVMMMALLGLSLINHYRKNIKMFWYYIIGTSVIIFNVFACGARSAGVGFVAGLLLWGFLKSKKMFIIIMIILIGVGSVLYYNVSAFKSNVDSFKKIHRSYRWQIWYVAVSMIKDHPIIGVGHGNFIKHYDKYKKEEYWRKRMGHPHNDYLSIYLTTGLIGFIGYILLWFLIIKKGTTEIINKKNYAAGLISGIAAFLVAGLGQNYFTDSEDSMLLWFFISVLIVLYYKDRKRVLIKDEIKKIFIRKK